MRAGTWNTFVKRFDPQMTATDNTPLHEWADVQNLDPHYVWTVLDCEGKLYCSTGFHWVNRFAYLKCSKPWTDAEAMRNYVY